MQTTATGKLKERRENSLLFAVYIISKFQLWATFTTYEGLL